MFDPRVTQLILAGENEVTTRIVSDHKTMERFVGHKLNDADATLALLIESGSEVTHFVTEGKQWQAVSQSPLAGRLGVPVMAKS